MEIYDNNPTAQPKRSFLLWFLAICTMVNAGASIFTYLIYMLFPQVMQQSMEVMQNMPMFNNDQYRQVLDLYLSLQSWQYGLLLIAEIAIFAGALIMLWKLKPIGLHIYILGQAALFCVQNFVIGGLMRATWDSILWTVLIIVMYYLEVRQWKTQTEPAGDTDSGEEDPEDDD